MVMVWSLNWIEANVWLNMNNCNQLDQVKRVAGTLISSYGAIPGKIGSNNSESVSVSGAWNEFVKNSLRKTVVSNREIVYCIWAVHKRGKQDVQHTRVYATTRWLTHTHENKRWVANHLTRSVQKSRRGKLAFNLLIFLYFYAVVIHWNHQFISANLLTGMATVQWCCAIQLCEMSKKSPKI